MKDWGTLILEVLLLVKQGLTFLNQYMKDTELRGKVQAVKDAKTEEEVHAALRDVVRSINK